MPMDFDLTNDDCNPIGSFDSSMIDHYFGQQAELFCFENANLAAFGCTLCRFTGEDRAGLLDDGRTEYRRMIAILPPGVFMTAHEVRESMFPWRWCIVRV